MLEHKVANIKARHLVISEITRELLHNFFEFLAACGNTRYLGQKLAQVLGFEDLFHRATTLQVRFKLIIRFLAQRHQLVIVRALLFFGNRFDPCDLIQREGPLAVLDMVRVLCVLALFVWWLLEQAKDV